MQSSSCPIRSSVSCSYTMRLSFEAQEVWIELIYSLMSCHRAVMEKSIISSVFLWLFMSTVLSFSSGCRSALRSPWKLWPLQCGRGQIRPSRSYYGPACSNRPVPFRFNQLLFCFISMSSLFLRSLASDVFLFCCSFVGVCCCVSGSFALGWSYNLFWKSHVWYLSIIWYH